MYPSGVKSVECEIIEGEIEGSHRKQLRESQEHAKGANSGGDDSERQVGLWASAVRSFV